MVLDSDVDRNYKTVRLSIVGNVASHSKSVTFL